MTDTTHQLKCQKRWTETTPGGTKIVVMCGSPMPCPTHSMQLTNQLPELTELQYEILCEMPESCEYCIGYVHLSHLGTRDELRPQIKKLREMGLVEYLRGLMNDDGEVAGSGFCRTYRKNDEINKMLERYEQKPKAKLYTESELQLATAEAVSARDEEIIEQITKMCSQLLKVGDKPKNGEESLVDLVEWMEKGKVL